jgi:hypothetical protein
VLSTQITRYISNQLGGKLLRYQKPANGNFQAFKVHVK